MAADELESVGTPDSSTDRPAKWRTAPTAPTNQLPRVKPRQLVYRIPKIRNLSRYIDLCLPEL